MVARVRHLALVVRASSSPPTALTEGAAGSGEHGIRVATTPWKCPLSIASILGIASLCALATNVGFLYKHRGACQAPAVDIHKPIRSAQAAVLLQAVRDRLGPRATGAWVFHVAAMAVAPLSTVQAVLAGGVVMLAVVAERCSAARSRRRQWVGIVLTAVGLLLLGLTLPAAHGAHSRFSIPGMIGFESRADRRAAS